MHYDNDFVRTGKYAAVAEELNAGGCRALRCVAEAFAGDDAHTVFIPLFAVCTRDASGTWRIASLTSPDAFARDVASMIRRRVYRDALLSHAVEDLSRVWKALRNRTECSVIVVRISIVFGDESSHVNALIVRGDTATLFEPRQLVVDTKVHPCKTLRNAVAEQLLCPLGIRLSPAPRPAPTLQTRDDLCQTWVAAFVAHSLAGSASPVGALASARGCDPLCSILRFSEWVYNSVPFPRMTRRGVLCATLMQRIARTSRHFEASPRRCGS